jgi:hypothetical protein
MFKNIKCHDVRRVEKLASGSGTITKHDFIKLLKSSELFMKTFDKNRDGIVTEVSEALAQRI